MDCLTKESLKFIFPEYENLMNYVKHIRKQADGEHKFQEYEYYPYSNIISILGERGSGKTTVFHTIRKMLKNKRVDENIENKLGECLYNDNHSTLIIPEMLEDSNDILGIVLLELKKIIDDRRDDIMKYYNCSKRKISEEFSSCSYSNETKIEKNWNQLFEVYLRRKEGFEEIVESNYSTMPEYIKERGKSLSSEVEMREQIYSFFTELCKIFTEIYKEQSLLFFYFDDVDINQNRCAEVMNTILRYMKHPNVVVFISGDENKISQELLWHGMKKDGGMNTCVDSVKLLENNQKEYIDEFMKKVMPYASRFRLKTLKNGEKKMLIYPGEDTVKTFEVLLKEKLGIEIQDCVYRIFDYKPRGIITIWNYLEVFGGLEKGNKELEYSSLVNNIVSTNGHLKKQKKIISSCIYFFEDKENNIFVRIEYERFLNYVVSSLQNIDVHQDSWGNEKVELQEAFMDIVQLFYFCELLTRKEKINNSGRQLGSIYSNMLNSILEVQNDKKVYFDSGEDVEIMIALYNGLMHVLDVRQQKEIFNNIIYFESYKKIMDKEKLQEACEKFDKPFYHRYKEKCNSMKKNEGEWREWLLRVFEGVDFSGELLESERNIEEFKVNAEVNEDSEMLEHEIDINSNNLQQKAINQYTEQALQLNETTEALNDIKDDREDLLKAILSSEVIEQAADYIDATDYHFLGSMQRKMGESKINAHEIIKVLCIIKSFAHKNINKTRYFNKATSTNIKKQNIKLNVPEELREYVPYMLDENYVKIPDLENDRVIFEQLGNVNANDINDNRREIKIQLPESVTKFIENVGDKDMTFSYYDNSGGWCTRRKNYITQWVEVFVMLYIIMRCEELLQDYIFINQGEEKLLKFDETKFVTASYSTIGECYYKWYMLIKKQLEQECVYDKISSRIAIIKDEVKKMEEYYTLSDIYIPSLSSLMRVIKNVEFSDEIKYFKAELEVNGKVRKNAWESFYQRLEYYVDRIQSQKGNEFNAGRLREAFQQLRIKKEQVITAPVISEIEKNVYKKILQSQLVALVLIMKDHLSSKFNKEVDENKNQLGEKKLC